MITRPNPQIGIAGTGSYLPETVITNHDLAVHVQAEGGKGSDWAEEKLGIKERRFLTKLDPLTGFPTGAADELDMAEKAARAALADANLQPHEVEGLWYISCTQRGPERHHFSTSAFELHKRLGLRAEAIPLEMDAGCGGVVHAVANGHDMLKGSGRDNMLIVAANAPSRYYEGWKDYVKSNTYLSMYVFADGAGAIVLRRSENIPTKSTLLAQYLGVDPSQPLMYHRIPKSCTSPVYDIDGRGVAVSFGKYARRALDGLQEKTDFHLLDAHRFYFHQVNGMVLRKFIQSIGLSEDRVPIHVDRYGNVAAAATPVLLDEDRKAGRVSSGDTCVICTVGAGAQYGAILVRL